VCAPLLVVLTGALVSAQTLLPSAPPRRFGGSVSPAFEGWWDNPDGTHTFLLGYFSRNTEDEVDIPIGPNNRIEPGDADQGQPTHFLPGRHFGMFTITVPKEFAKTQKLVWWLTSAGYATSVPMYMSPDYNITPQRASEQGPNGLSNLPPVIRFELTGASFTFPNASLATALSRSTTVGASMPLDIYVEDDAQYASGANTPVRHAPPIVTLEVSKYRGPGKVAISTSRPPVAATKGGKPLEPFAGKASTNVTFGEAGDYLLHVMANDLSGPGGGGAACCWTTALMKVSVTGERPTTTGGQ
jgi:hypothetical protein